MKIWSLAAVLLPLSSAFAGAPLVCHDFDIGGARSLPWGSKAGYDRDHLVEDVAAILKTENDLMVRMETLRRAALYVDKDKKLAWELLGQRSLALLDQAATGSKESTAWFDAGFLVACFRQADIDLGYRAGVAEGIDGYSYFKTALDRARAEGSDQIGTIEFAAALACHPAMIRGGGDDAAQERFRKHLEAARRAAAPGSLLEKNLSTHVANWKGHYGL